MYKCVSYNHGLAVSAREKLHERVFDGYSYVFSKQHRSTIYVVCVKKRAIFCKGTGKIKNGKFYSLHRHNHNPDITSKTILEFERALRKKVLEDRFQSLKSIYDEISLLFPQAAVKKTWVQMASRMQYWRKEVQPPIPNSLQHYQEILNKPRWKFFTKNNQNDKKMYVSTLQCEDMSYVTLYGNAELLQNIKTSCLLMDATFTVVPKKPQSLQLFTILALINDSAIPIIWVLMERKTTSAYTKILHHLHTVCAPQLRPEIIISDFESALSSSIKSIFPEVHHTGCFFHYCQALIKRLKKKKLLQFIFQWRNGDVIIKNFLAIALLPPQKIIDGFEWLITTMPHDIRSKFKKFIEYYQRQWIQRVKPEFFSVFKKNIRTNNYVEAYNRVITKKLGIHPNIWEFTKHINHCQQNSLLEYESLRLGNRTRRTMRNHNMMYEERIQKLWKFYELDMLTIPQFLACASYDMKAFTGNKIIHEIELLEPPNSEIFQEFDLENTIFI